MKLASIMPSEEEEDEVKTFRAIPSVSGFERSSNVKYDTNMEEKKFKNYSDQEFKEALRATLNLKKEWMASVAQREKELGIQ